MPSSVILGTARTPFGKMGGGLKSLDATDLGGTVIEAALDRSGVAPEQVEQVVFGQVLQAGQGQIPSRQAQIKGGIPKEVPSETINKVCASGMRSVGIADQAIRAGDSNVAVTGGMESMSNAPYLLPGARFGFRMGDIKALDAMTHDGLTNPFTNKQMINEASEVGNELEISRVDMDRFAERSHRLANEATEAGRLAEEIVGVTVKSRKGESTVEADEAIRPDTTLETLAKLKAIGGDDATHTAGNAPGVNDGAGAIVVASEEWAEKEGKAPLARILSYGTVADDFPYLAKTPANAAKQALEKIGKSADEVDLWEINEASEVSNELEITRADMDRFAERSHRLAAEATDAGRLADEIAGITVKSRKGEHTVEADEAIRPDTTLETLAKLKAIGGDDATHTAGNAPGVNDGAGAIVVASEEWAEKEGKTPLARILSYGTVADDFPYLAKTPANAAKQALEKIGKSADEVDLWEINEAFASVALNSVRMLGVDEEKVNVNGGAIALGHPIGASGSRIIGALVHELRRRGGGLGVAAICSGGGQGDAIVLEVNGG